MGRYVKLNIATPMCRLKLCVFANLPIGLALERRCLGPTATTHNYNITMFEETALVHHQLDDSDILLFRVLEVSPTPFLSSLNLPRYIDVS